MLNYSYDIKIFYIIIIYNLNALVIWYSELKGVIASSKTSQELEPPDCLDIELSRLIRFALS